MKKFISLSLAIIFLLAGCSFGGSEEAISVSLDKQIYQVNPANPSAFMEVQVENNSGKEIYYHSPRQKKSIIPHQKNEQGKWIAKPELFTVDLFLTGGDPKVYELKNNETQTFKKNLSISGEFKLEFIYYTSEKDCASEKNPNSVFSQSFIIGNSADFDKQAIIDTCHSNYSATNRRAECLYIAAKDIAITDLPISLALCKEIDKMDHNFDGCYQGVALVLNNAGSPELGEKVCENYQNKDLYSECLNKLK